MKTKVDKVPLEFCSTVLSVGKQLTPNAILYWARKQERLLKILSLKNDFQPVTAISSEPFDIPALPETTRGILWRKRIIDRNFADEFLEAIPKIVPPTLPARISMFSLNVRLEEGELFSEMEIKSADDLRDSAFSYSQVVWLTARHGSKKESLQNSVLDYEKATYLPLLQADGTVCFVHLLSKKDFKRHLRWKGWLQYNETFFEGTLLLKEDIPGLDTLQ